MDNFDKLQVYKSQLSQEDFSKIARYVEENFGIKMPPNKILMVQNRLYRRLIALQIPDFRQYVKFLFSPLGRNELNELANVLTTNKTEFFRESDHFDKLKEIAAEKSFLNIWSAACSTGEEVYSIAFVLEEINVNYKIIGSDISKNAIDYAQKATYTPSQIVNIPKQLLNKYFTTDTYEGTIRYQVVPKVRNKVRFLTLNLLKPYPFARQSFDVIFLRNVLIYFKQDLQLKIIKKVADFLTPSGYLFLGHSETILDSNLPFKRIAPSVYQKIT